MPRHPAWRPCARASNAERALDAALARRAEAKRHSQGSIPTGDRGSSAEHLAPLQACVPATAAENEVGAIRERLHAAERERESLAAQTAALGRALDVPQRRGRDDRGRRQPASAAWSATRSRCARDTKRRSPPRWVRSRRACSSTTSTRVSPPLALRATPISDGSIKSRWNRLRTLRLNDSASFWHLVLMWKSGTGGQVYEV